MFHNDKKKCVFNLQLVQIDIFIFIYKGALVYFLILIVFNFYSSKVK